MENLALLVGGLVLMGAVIVVGAVVMAVLTALVSVGTMPFVFLIVGIERVVTGALRWHRGDRPLSINRKGAERMRW